MNKCIMYRQTYILILMRIRIIYKWKLQRIKVLGNKSTGKPEKRNVSQSMNRVTSRGGWWDASEFGEFGACSLRRSDYLALLLIMLALD